MAMQLASFQLITEIKAHLNADTLELAQVLGWQVVVRKGDFSVGQNVVFLQPDSILPDAPWSAFLKKGTGRLRLKNIRLRGQLSQGLVLSLATLKLTGNEDPDTLTETLGITKYSKDEERGAGFISGRAKPESTFPAHLVPKTDEERIQNMPWLLPMLQDQSIFWSEKFDGTSGTYIYDAGVRYVCSRNQDLQEDEKSVYWAMYRKYIKEVFDAFGNSPATLPRYAIQGEIVGPGIQKNPLGLAEVEFFVFNVYDIEARAYLHPIDMRNFCKAWGLKTVSIMMENPQVLHLIDLLQFANREYTAMNGIAANRVCEGVVGVVYIFGQRVSFKVINDEYKD